MHQHLVLELLLRLAEQCATPRALTVAILARSGEWKQVLDLRVDPSVYRECDFMKLKADLAVTELLRKCKLPWVDSSDTYSAAVRAFWASETQCAETNSRLRRFVPSKHLLGGPEDMLIYSVVEQIRKEIASVLPAVPRWLTPRFSSGATISDKGKLTTLPDKLTSRPTCYPATAYLLEPCFWATAWGGLHILSAPRYVRENVFFTVPKDNEKDRGCAKEASVNVTLQLDAARIIRIGLRRWGINLERNQDLHRDLARRASLDGSLATIDLSNASDTLSRVLVELLLPREWYELLSSLRATHTKIEGKSVRLEKFSSMGNGFTFELETLIFAAVARVITRVCHEDVSEVYAYGDDILMPSPCAPLMCKTLSFLGFTPNWKKTFWEGLFRESCGGDYFNGKPVRAHYLKELPCDPQGLIALANGLRRMDAHWALKAWRYVLSLMPTEVRKCRGPEHLGDIVIHDIPDFWRTRLLRPKPTSAMSASGEGVMHVRAYVPRRAVLGLEHWKPLVLLTGALVGLDSTGVIPRGDPLGYRTSWVPLQEPQDGKWRLADRGPAFAT